jgi:hypothetical protein
MVLVCVGEMRAQTSTGSVYGSVTDKQGLAVAGASVTVKSTDLATVRTATTNGLGAFAMTGLVPGAYTVEAAKDKLVTRRAVRLTVGLGSSTQVVLPVDVAVVRQRTTVTARAGTSEGNTTTPPINQTEPEVLSFFAGTVVTYLPNKVRDISQFDQLGTNAHEDADGSADVMDGQRPSAGLVTVVDGVTFDSPLMGGLRGGEDRGVALPQTVVREFQVLSSGVSAEVGGTSAGLINLATKEGSNKLHGEAFYQARPSTLTSANGFGQSLDATQNVIGLSEGGDLRKNKSFFYAGIEQGFIHAPMVTAFAPQAAGVVVPAALAGLQGEIAEKETPFSLAGRIDQVLSANETLNVELAGERVRIQNASDGQSRTLATLANAENVGGQSLWGKVGLTSVLGPRSVNQALVAWSVDHRGVTPNSTAPEQVVNGFGVLGGNGLGPHLYTSQQWQLGDDVAVSRGMSLFTVGGALHIDPAYEQREENQNGRFDYNSLTALEQSAPRRFQQTFVTGTTRYQATVEELALYANAHVTLRKNLTLTAGVRWAAQWNPQPPHPNAAIAQTQRVPNDAAQWQPRVGLAWNAAAKTTVRVSAGLYDAPTPATVFHRVFADSGTQTVTADSYFDPQLLTLTGANTASPHALTAAPAGLTTPEAVVVGIGAGFRNARSGQAAVSVDQTISPKLTLRGGFLYAETWRLGRMVDENLAAPTVNPQGLPVFLAPRPRVGVGRLLVNESNAHSNYDGVSVSAISQISRRSQFTVNYTASRTRDDASSDGPYEMVTAVNPYNLAAERGYSSLDVRSVLNASAIFNLPYGLKLNPLEVVRSGAPYTGLIGFDMQNDANDWNDRVVVAGLETPRNLYRQPLMSDTDLRMVKDFTLKGEGHHLDLFMDIFNLLGAQNRSFGPDGVSVFGSAALPLASAGLPLYAPGASRVGGPRTFQFTARLVGF